MSYDAKALQVLCPNCGSDNVHCFRYDADWGYGGDYTPVNDGIPESERPDVECLHCRECYAAFDGPAYDKDGKRGDYLGRMADRLAALEDALDHIARVARNAIRQSRRARGIECRAKSALSGEPFDPRNMPPYPHMRREKMEALEAENQRMRADNLEAVRAFGRGAQRIGTARIVEIVKERMPHVDDRYANEVAGRFHALPSGFANTFNQDVADALIVACLECGALAAGGDT